MKRLLVGRPHRHHRAGAPAPPQDHRAGGVLVGRHLVDGVRDRGDPVRHWPSAARASPSGSRSSCPIAIVVADPARDRRHVVPPDDLRLPERRRLLHREPREPRRVPVARRRRLAAGRLHPHRRGVDLGRRRRHHLHPRVPGPRPTSASCSGSGSSRSSPWPTCAASRSRAGIFAVPTYIYIVDARRCSSATGCTAAYFGHIDHGAVRSRRSSRAPAQTGGTLGLFLILQGLLVGRGRAHRRRGDLQRRARVPAAGAEERGDHARVDGRSSSARSSSASRCSPTTSSRTRATTETVISQMGRAVFGSGPLYVVLQFATAAILMLAANTAYADFPRLSSIIARDGYLPRQFANRGDRLVFSNGIVFLAVAAGVAHRRLRRPHQRADPALRGRRVHLVHAVPGRHGAPPPARAGAAAGNATRAVNGVGSVATFIVAAHRRDHQVHVAAPGCRSSWSR